jgi:hypothetical protein
MKNIISTRRALVAIVVVVMLSGCATSSMMKPAEVIKPRPDYAVVNFMRPAFMGNAIMFGMWDGEDLVGILTYKKYIPYKATPGEHIFMARAENWAVIKANLKAGKTYNVLVSPHMGFMKARVGMEVLKPDDKRIDEWLAKLPANAVDPAQRDAYVKDRLNDVREAVKNVQAGNASFIVMNPDDGR